MRTCVVTPSRTTGGKKEEKEDEEEEEVEEEGGGKNMSASDPDVHAPSTCPMHAGTVVYTNAALHADAVV
eukprot:2498027-Pyramimonas_sp.AAC.1